MPSSKGSAGKKGSAKAAGKGAPRRKAAKQAGAKKKAGHAPAPPPDAVRVWRGFKLASLAQPDFLNYLGATFIPATVQLQRLYGLVAYLPTVMPLEKPAGVPDELALVFYESQQAYTDQSQQIVTGRAYSLLHHTVFDLTPTGSESGFPIPLPARPKADTPYYLFPDAVDWQQGFSQVFVGARKPADPTAGFMAAVSRFLAGVKRRRPKGLDGAIACVSKNLDYVVYWEHWESEGASLGGRISDLAGLSDLVLLQPFTPTPVETDLAAHYPGLKVTGGQSLNTRFTRPAQS